MNRFSTVALLLLLLTFFQAMSQVKGTIKGRALDGSTRRPVEFASVALLSAVDSSLVKGAMTDTSGVFVISNLSEGNNLITLSSIEYQKVFKGPILINCAQQ